MVIFSKQSSLPPNSLFLTKISSRIPAASEVQNQQQEVQISVLLDNLSLDKSDPRHQKSLVRGLILSNLKGL